MQTVLQLGQRQLSLQQILEHLTKSAFLPQYLGLAIIEETLTIWQQSPEYFRAFPQAESGDIAAKITDRQNGDRLQLAENAMSAQQQALILQTYKQVNWGHRIPSYFLVRKTQLDRVIFSAIQVETIGLAQELYLRVKDRKQSLDKLARLYSQGAEAKLGGVMGPISVHQLHPEIIYHLASLKQGELSPLFRLNNFHIFIRLEQRIPARFDDEMQQYLLDELFEQWLQQEVTSRIANLSLIDLVSIESEISNYPAAGAINDRAIDTEMDSSISIGNDEPLSPLDLPEDRPSIPIVPSTSFFLPSIEAGHNQEITNDSIATSAFLMPEISANPQFERLHRQQFDRQRILIQQLLAFLIFFGLFLSGGYGAIYLLNFLIGTPSAHIERKS